MEICRKCGSPLRDGDKFCSQCGARVTSRGSRYEKKRRAEAEKKRQEKKIEFRTGPEKKHSYRENFEEGESRRRALRWTVLALTLMAVCAAAVLWLIFRPEKKVSPDGSAARIAGTSSLSETQTASAQTSEAQTQPASAQTSGVQAQPASAQTSEAQTQPASAQTAETQAPVQTEKVSETQTALPKETPDAASVIDVSQIQSILQNQCTATASEIYIYDLNHNTEAAVGDCTQQMFASALITVPILYTAASRVDAGAMTMDDQIPYTSSIGGRGEAAESRDGNSYPLSFYLQTMVNYSDNNCINILIGQLSLDLINSTCRNAGYTSVNLQRGLVNGDTGGLDNYVSAKDLSGMVRDLVTGKFTSVGTKFMDQYFHIDQGDALPTLAGLAPSLSDADRFLNQNGYGETRFNETCVVGDGGSNYILTIMLYGEPGFTYNTAVTDIAEYVNEVMTV